jgi:spore coat polysaccharide biosynthesis predicted glycosyltransferase SpsG/RimJ/RimL family protein N-acetyltransferase
MNVCIITEVLEDTGYGHITRCISLYQAFEQAGFIPLLIVNADSKAKQFLKNFNSVVFDWGSNSKTLQQIIGGIKIIVVDSYRAGIDFYEMISSVSRFPVFLDDNIRLNYPPSIVVNGTLLAENFNYPNDKNLYLLGTKYIPIRKEFWNISTKRINKRINSILITIGGQDIRNLTPSVLQSVVKIYPAVKKTVVLGKGFTRISEIKKSADKNTIFVHDADARTMNKLMLESDLAVSAGGQTIYELARTGVPTLAIGVVENQKINIENWKKTCFIKDVGWWDDKNLFKNLEKKLVEIADYVKRKKMSEKGKSLVDGLGSKRIVDKIIEQISMKEGFYLRKAMPSDMKKVYTLSNERLVRTNSVNQNLISWREHVSWYDKKIHQKNYDFFVAYDCSNFVGQVRFEIEGYKAIISVSLAKDFRGKGLSYRIISEGSRLIFLNRKNVRKIFAYIRAENNSSIEAFTKSGYRFLRKEVIDKQQFEIYLLNRSNEQNGINHEI